MKRIYSYLVIIITIITLYTMFTIKPNEVETLVNETIEEKVYDVQDENTGYIFDDFNRGINIKLEENKTKDKEEKKTNKQSLNNIEKLKYIYDTYIASEYYNIDSIAETTQVATYDVMSMENKISLDDKAYIFSLIKYLKPSDILILNDIIKDGVTEKEADYIFKILKDRLPKEKYEELIGIVYKYSN
ncbi:MAG: hypothetical protein KatS3mg079_595 [Caloramator sp.]|uniref:Uncharacterized protein n=1 Tax=Caloramator proteoclasticus DSM 10124 TaxID=1121262 RepID=A0A1M4SCA1_9CLOT|nr:MULTISPECIES: hypothetical protein [Caloramator]GIW49119.1 MAG: hypothetical protein KatS3mg079_595 [Caloramator sp.]SHE29755.1 hypothetical protein SAMN02746091_00111 [Caloramator proteoclasticus DSM 10124]